MPDFSTVATIVLMASTTYLSRILGYVMLRNRPLGPRMAAVMENVPGCVLISVIAPAFVSTRPADLLALGITIVAATRLSILPTVAIGVVAAGVLRHLLG
ncbi:hypothetical protein WL92_24805 [Burkholderia multivorans]|uniref:AzlD family protein n=1 Tax=Burkholderia multivorans TaxID=87883 RepID=UPI00075A6F96|nr:AzlD family protein [Burkholderia multivorans]KWF72382.1 hypothetical protein WL91_08625 [Burkholderia multivorans]KWF75280.1 hypothetical protein WL92_24805 [Burkholderia multivorans]